MSYLTNQNTDDRNRRTTPLIRAAGEANKTTLEALLARFEELDKWRQDGSLSHSQRNALRGVSPNVTVMLDDIAQSPINAALGANLPDNARLLLAAGADPNGIKHASIAYYSVRWIRGRDFRIDFRRYGMCPERVLALRDAHLREGIVHPSCPITEAELEERRHGFIRFWTEPNVPGQRLRMQRALTALEVAARTGNVELVDMLRAAGAEESAWLQPTPPAPELGKGSNFDDADGLFDIRDEKDVPISALSTTSPIHEAIATGQVRMLWHLLSTCGYSPNYRPRAAPTVALPPLSYAIARCNLDDPGVQRCLADLLTHPQLDANIRTPIFGIHPLHFATAHHNPELLSWLAHYISGGLAAAGKTTLGHTLLHIACLPLTAGQTNVSHLNVLISIHCIRTMDPRWNPYHLPSPIPTKFKTPQQLALPEPQPMTEAQQQAQKATIQFLLAWGGCDVGAQDMDGNTALHYLAGTLGFVEETIELVRRVEGGEEVWHGAKNIWGLTPRDLWVEPEVRFPWS